ncbi:MULTISPECIES: hypothetical protein [unclassified Cupriavidus]|uniref:hypothetical protein n=1 Tax=Cupriavidus sp. H19C3 TaxID=3241603 RepID=UPI003BF8BCEC
MAKSKIDLSDPSVKFAIELYGNRASVAAQVAASKDAAVRPIYALNARTDRVEQVGSCVLLAIADQVFALSASHVFDAVGAYRPLIGCGAQLHPLPGDRFSSSPGPSGTHRDDPVDASVFHITAAIPDEIRDSALAIDDLDILPSDREKDFFVATGYRNSQSKSTAKGHMATLDGYPTVELNTDHYEHWELDRNRHLLLASEDEMLLNMKWQKAPSIRGLSGGAIFRIDGIHATHAAENRRTPRAKLAAILIERRMGVRDKIFPAIVGTRLGVHFGLIHKYLPDLYLDEILAEECQHQSLDSSVTSHSDIRHGSGMEG